MAKWWWLSVSGAQALHLGVSGEEALRYFGNEGASLPLTPSILDSLNASTFASYARRGVPVVIKHGLDGTSFDVEQKPAEWTCDAIARRFPTGRMKMEYTAGEGRQDNPISLKDVETWSKTIEKSGALDPEAPQYAPFYWGVKGGDEGERLWDGKKDLLKQMRKLMQPLPKFLHRSQANQQEILGSPEFWFAGPGAGAKAHMDSHCESTLTLQLAGRKRWRLSWPPAINNGSFAKDGLLADGEPYNVKGGWAPTYSVTLAAGEALLIPPAFVHESKNVGPEDCAPSLTFQFADPAAAGFFRHFHPRLRRLGDFNECWERVAALATFDSRGEGLAARLKRMASTSLAKLSKLESGGSSPLESAVLEAAKKAWPKVVDTNGRLTRENVKSDFILQGSLDFHDLNEDGEVTEAEFTSTFSSWLMTEVLVVQERKQKPKPLKHIEF
ncbi:unnamed protein product [Effrenium voratum]|uniref:JmjC domain-containing protein n=1 Tax=Effrenium voratum TaxID=2562239 RepID=A0AA36IL71_9DINO|nr:unnamed protein product [Effrenium voratum]